ncbi:MAG: M48 family metalloprotease [Verrucomicrobiales bacterium]|nr:M48 family metalloprotease [Verrucomicrobiales bacterium]
MPQSSPFPRRAVMAIGLMLGFHLLALSMAAGLLYLPWAAARRSGEPNARVTIYCWLGAAFILWSVAPRRDRFRPPGPRLRPADQPRLFAELESVARATGQTMPSRVYLIHDLNASVSERGGMLGMGGRRFMALGLPLMQVLTVPQFRGVIAHEFGHYQAGDTRLSPWIYRTHSAMARMLDPSLNSWGILGILRLPFQLYGRWYLRLTQADSRRQEHAADALASRIVGPAQVAAGLRVIHQTAPAYEEFLRREYLPVMGAGFLPPLAEGFQHFVHVGEGSAIRSPGTGGEPEPETSDPFDSHPSLPERLAALGPIPTGAALDEGPPAASLLDDLPELESKLLSAAFPECGTGHPEPISWQEVGTRVYAPHWRRLVDANRDALKTLDLSDLPWIARNPNDLARRLRGPDGHALEEDAWEAGVAYAIGAAVSLNLLERGWSLETYPGRPERMFSPQGELQPFSLTRELASGERSWSDWTEFLSRTGLSDAALLPAAVPTTTTV